MMGVWKLPPLAFRTDGGCLETADDGCLETASLRYAQAERARNPGDDPGPTEEWFNDRDTNPGIVICIDGQMFGCVLPTKDHPVPGQCKAYDQCVLTHEEAHFKQYDPCGNSKRLRRARHYGTSNEDWEKKNECPLPKASVECMKKIDAKGGADVPKVIASLQKWITGNCC